jgi:hypothetical protein
MSSESVCQVAHSWVDMGSFHTRLFRVNCGYFHNGSEKGKVCIKLCANLGKSATETLMMIQQASGDQILRCTQVLQWHAQFKTDCTSVDADEQTGRLTICTTPQTVARIQELVRQDRRQTILNIAEEVRVGYGTCQRVLMKEFGTHHDENRPGCFTMTMPHLILLSSTSSF